jgi:uncharacterized repeat protein (TIGR01451 family)
MARQSSSGSGSVSFLRGLFARLWKRPELKAASRRTRRRMFMEQLDSRTVLASDLGAIEGLIYVDTTGNGFNIGEEVAGALVDLYADDGDGVFEPGVGVGLDGAPIRPQQATNANGEYFFADLGAGDYWVNQIAQVVGPDTLLPAFEPVTISALQEQGTPGTLIDSFVSAVPTAVAADPVGTTNAATADLLAAEVLGLERDFQVELTSSPGGQTVTMTVSADKLSLNPSIQAQGRYRAVWDGDDNNGAVIDHTGLANYDLTDLGASAGIVLEDVLADQTGGSATIRVYTDATNFSTLTVNIPANAATDLFFKFTDFTTGGGTGADFTDVGAIELVIDSTVDAMDGEIELIEAIGYNSTIVDFDNFFESDLSLTKDVDNATPNVGDDVTFTIVVTNGGPDDALNVAVQDLLPAGLTFVSDTTLAGTYNEVTGLWTIGTITSGGTATLTVVATAATFGAKTNTAEVSASDSNDADSTPGNGQAGEDDIESVVVTPQQIDLSLTKTPLPANLNVGSNVTFTLTVTNAAGVSNATGVVVTDLLPAGLTYVSDTPSVGAYDDVTGIWTVGALNAGANATLTIVATKTVAGAIINTAEVTAANQPDVDSTPGNRIAQPAEDDTASATVNDVLIDLSLTKTPLPTSVNIGANVTFTLTVSNAAGVGNATGVVVTDLLPAGLTYVSDTPSVGAYDEVTGIWTVGALNAGANATLTIVATKANAGAIINTAEVTDADQPDVDSTPDNRIAQPAEDDTATATVNDLTIDLALTKIVSNATQNVGQNVTFTLTLANSGLGNATGVVVTDLLPAGLTYVSDTPSAGTTYDEVTGIWTVGALNTGSNATLQIVATVATAGVKTNTAQVTAAVQTDVDSTPNNIGVAPNEDDTATATVTPPSIDLSIDKTVNNASPNVGQNVVFTIIVSNAAAVSNATGVVVTDLLPAGLTFVSATQTQGAYSGGTGLWTVGALNAGANATLTITATVANVGAKTNFAEVTAADQADADSTPNNRVAQPGEDDTDSVIVTPQTIDLSLTKTVNTATPNKNQNVTFTITVSNAAAQSNATGVAVTDLLPAGFTFVSSTPSVGTYNSTTGVWTVGAVNTGASATLSIVATVTTIGAKINAAEVTAADQADTDSTPGNRATIPGEDDTATVTVTPAVSDLSLTKTVDDATPDRNQNVVFTLTLTNGGPQTATNVTVTDLLPAGMTFVSSNPGGGTTYNSTTGVWTVASLNSGANVVLTITATTATVGAKTNTAEVTASDQFDSDSTPGNRATVPGEDDTASATVTPNATDLSVTKTVDDASPEIGQNVTFTITVTNTSATNATNVVLTDLLPAGLTFVSSTPSQGAYVSATGIWTIGTINANSAVTMTVVATVANNTTKVNSAEITSLDQFDSDSTPNNGGTAEDDRATVTVQPFLLSKRNCVVR